MIPAEYRKTRDSIHRECQRKMHAGEMPKGKEEGESCMHYAKRVASAIYTKRHGVTPQQAESEIKLIEDVEKMLGLVDDEDS